MLGVGPLLSDRPRTHKDVFYVPQPETHPLNPSLVQASSMGTRNLQRNPSLAPGEAFPNKPCESFFMQGEIRVLLVRSEAVTQSTLRCCNTIKYESPVRRRSDRSVRIIQEGEEGGVAHTNAPVYQNSTRPWPVHLERFVKSEPEARCDRPAFSSPAPCVSSPLQAAGGEECAPSGESNRITQIRNLNAEQTNGLRMGMR
ncbi:hypothetical protein GOODEAATRI_014355 [Goodea atripinnis]|uniref:Uncharacterized protein n=1 Tax=Goodea atripinnis TaxID=208336 RepID=A0ABV0PNI3_9TELE